MISHGAAFLSVLCVWRFISLAHQAHLLYLFEFYQLIRYGIQQTASYKIFPLPTPLLCSAAQRPFPTPSNTAVPTKPKRYRSRRYPASKRPFPHMPSTTSASPQLRRASICVARSSQFGRSPRPLSDTGLPAAGSDVSASRRARAAPGTGWAAAGRGRPRLPSHASRVEIWVWRPCRSWLRVQCGLRPFPLH